LDACSAGENIDVQNLIQFAEAEQYALWVRHGAGGQARSCTPCDYRDAELMANT
jgi:hypothetical protein